MDSTFSAYESSFFRKTITKANSSSYHSKGRSFGTSTNFPAITTENNSLSRNMLKSDNFEKNSIESKSFKVNLETLRSIKSEKIIKTSDEKNPCQ